MPDSWTVMARLADEVDWRAAEVNGRLVFRSRHAKPLTQPARNTMTENENPTEQVSPPAESEAPAEVSEPAAPAPDVAVSEPPADEPEPQQVQCPVCQHRFAVGDPIL